jgi:hypothetical protein
LCPTVTGTHWLVLSYKKHIVFVFN